MKEQQVPEAALEDLVCSWVWCQFSSL